MKNAYKWLESLPSGAKRDEGISYMIRREASDDPQALVPWLELISEPTLREKKKRELESRMEP